MKRIHRFKGIRFESKKEKAGKKIGEKGVETNEESNGIDKMIGVQF